MNCQRIKELIPAYMDEELQPNEMKEVREHLSVCSTCQKEFETFEKSWAMLGELDEIQPEPGFIGRFWSRLALEQSWQEKIKEVMENMFSHKQLVPVLATLCIMILVGSFAGYYYAQTQKTNRTLAKLNQNELAMVENIELAENLSLIAQLDFLEDLEIIKELDVIGPSA